MFPSGFPDELRRLCSLVYGDHVFALWFFSGAEAAVVTLTGVRECSVEENVLLHQLAASMTEKQFLLPASHVLLRNELTVNGDFIAHRQMIGTSTLIIASATNQSFRNELVLNLIRDKEQEWQLRQHLAQLIDTQQQQIQQLEERNQLLLQRREQSVRQLVQQWCAEQSGIQILFDDGCYKLLEESGSEYDIRSQLDQALRLVRFTHPGNQFYRITAAHLQIVPKTPEVTQVPLNPNQRVELLLDKYEASARVAQQRGYTVNGKTIAEHLQPSISPPAITDALKKNRKAISNLLEQYPERWGLLRKYLKPVKELNEHRLFQFPYSTE